MKKAILIASFGTTNTSAIEKSLLPLWQDAAAEFPQWEIRSCFTSHAVIRRLAQQGIQVNSLEQALQTLHQEGFCQVTILPALLTPGGEYRKILATSAVFSSIFSNLTVAQPLLSQPEDLQAISSYFQKNYPLADREALLLVGHGTSDSDNPELQNLAAMLPENMFLAALMGVPDFSLALAAIENRGYRRVTLVPLMLTAGEHVLRHLSGPSETSWESQCRAAGLETRCYLVGLGEAVEIRKRFLTHLSASLPRN